MGRGLFHGAGLGLAANQSNCSQRDDSQRVPEITFYLEAAVGDRLVEEVRCLFYTPMNFCSLQVGVARASGRVICHAFLQRRVSGVSPRTRRQRP